jgi:hypothetical protein
VAEALGEEEAGAEIGDDVGSRFEYQIDEHKMIAVVIALGAGVCYWFEWYQLAFWILIYAIVYGILGALRAVMKTSDFSRGLWRPPQNRP